MRFKYWLRTFILTLLIFSTRFKSQQTYSLSFSEKEVEGAAPLINYRIRISINIVYHKNDLVTVTTDVKDVSNLHFSLFINGRNCGLIFKECSFQLRNGDALNFELLKFDMKSNIMTMVVYGSDQEPDFFIVGCKKNIPTFSCVSSQQYNTDTFDTQFLDSLCFCSYLLLDCAPFSNDDQCIDTTPWWSYDSPTRSTKMETSTIGTKSTKQYSTSAETSTTSISTTNSATTSTMTENSTTTTTTKTLNKTTTTILTSTKLETTTTPSINTSVVATSSIRTSTFLPITTTSVIPDTFPSLKNLSDSGVDINNISTILNQTLHYSNQKNRLNSTQVEEISTILYNCANVAGIRNENSIGILRNLDNILFTSQETIFNSGKTTNQVLNLLPIMVQNTVDDRIEYLAGTNLGFTSKKVDCSKVETDDGLIDLGTRFDNLNSGSKNVTFPHRNSIMVPLTSLCQTQDVSHLFFTIYRDHNLFAGKRKYHIYDARRQSIASSSTRSLKKMRNFAGEAEINEDQQNPVPSPCERQISMTNNPVMSATLMNNGLTLDLSSSEATAAILRFNVTGLVRPLHGDLKVTWWDTGRKQWASERQCQILSNSNGIVEAKCTHLTDFAIIVDAALNDPNVCDAALMNLGYVVNSFSIVSLAFLTFFSAASYQKSLSNSWLHRFLRGTNLVRRDFLALTYHFVMLLFYAMFTFFANQNLSGSFCQPLAAFMYALLLCSLFLTIFQGFRTMLAFLNPAIFQCLSCFISPPAILSISIVIPFLFSFLLLIFTTFFDRQDCFCWVRPDYVIYAIILPVSMLLLSSGICTSFVIYKVFFVPKRKFSQRGSHYYDPNITVKIVAVIIMQLTLGMPWILQFGTLYAPYTTFWHYCFTIIIGSQGTILVLIFFYKRHRAKNDESNSRSTEKSAGQMSIEVLSSSVRRRAITREENLSVSTDSSDRFFEY